VRDTWKITSNLSTHDTLIKPLKFGYASVRPFYVQQYIQRQILCADPKIWEGTTTRRLARLFSKFVVVLLTINLATICLAVSM